MFFVSAETRRPVAHFVTQASHSINVVQVGQQGIRHTKPERAIALSRQDWNFLANYASSPFGCQPSSLFIVTGLNPPLKVIPMQIAALLINHAIARQQGRPLLKGNGCTELLEGAWCPDSAHGSI
jgi:hypothetical protein